MNRATRDQPPVDKIYGPVPDDGVMSQIADRLRHSKVKADQDKEEKARRGRNAGWIEGYNWAIGQASYYQLKDLVEDPTDPGDYEAEGFKAACEYIFSRVDV